MKSLSPLVSLRVVSWRKYGDEDGDFPAVGVCFVPLSTSALFWFTRSRAEYVAVRHETGHGTMAVSHTYSRHEGQSPALVPNVVPLVYHILERWTVLRRGWRRPEFSGKPSLPPFAPLRLSSHPLTVRF